MIEVKRNTERQGVEIRFPAKPPEYVRERLKSHGWRFSRFAGCWWHKEEAETWEQAHELTRETPQEVAS